MLLSIDIGGLWISRARTIVNDIGGYTTRGVSFIPKKNDSA
jgi:ribosomal protein S17E